MFQTVTKIVKWISIPLLLIASLFGCCTARYEPLLDFVICLGAIVFITSIATFVTLLAAFRRQPLPAG